MREGNINERLNDLEAHLKRENPVLLDVIKRFRELDQIARRMDTGRDAVQRREPVPRDAVDDAAPGEPLDADHDETPLLRGLRWALDSQLRGDQSAQRQRATGRGGPARGGAHGKSLKKTSLTTSRPCGCR